MPLLRYKNQVVSLQGSRAFTFPSNGIVTPPVVPETPLTRNVFGYINSLYNHANPESAQNSNTRVGNWIARMLAASSVGHNFTLGANFGFLVDWPTPPVAGVLFEDVTTGPLIDLYTPSWTNAALINKLLFVPDNFDGQGFDPADVTNMGASYQVRILQLIDAWHANAPNAGREYVIWAGWPALNAYGATTVANLNSTQVTSWITYGLGAYQTWMELLVSRLQAARPSLTIRLHNCSRASLIAYRDTILNTVPYDVLWEDLAPHGRGSFYLIAAIAEYIELFNAKPPVPFTFNPLWEVSPIITANYSAIVDNIWNTLRG